jgi:hypothetical protein
MNFCHIRCSSAQELLTASIKRRNCICLLLSGTIIVFHAEYWFFRSILQNLLSPCSRHILEKLMVAQLVKEFFTFHETQSFILMYTNARHLDSVLSQLNPMHTIAPYLCKIYFKNNLPYMCLVSQTYLLHCSLTKVVLGFPSNKSYAK